MCRRRFPESSPVALPHLNPLRQTRMATAAAGVGLWLERRFLLTAVRTPRDQSQASRRESATLKYRATAAPAVRSALLGLGLAVMKDGSPDGAAASGGGFPRRLRIAIGPEIPRTTIASMPIVAITLVPIWELRDRVAVLGPEIDCPDDPAGARSPRDRRRPDARARMPVYRRTVVARSARRWVAVEIHVAAAGKRSAAPQAKRNDPTARQNRRIVFRSSPSPSPGGRC